MDKREAIIRDYFHSWITKDDSVLRDTFAEDALYIESWGPAYRGLPSITKWFQDWCAQHDVLAWDIKGFWRRDDTWVCEWFFRCRCGEVAEFDGVSVVRFDGGDKITYLKEFQSKLPNHYPYGEHEEECP